MRYRHTMTLFGISLPICLILRVLQSVFTIDSSTGFIKQQYSDISTVIMLVIFAGIASVGLMGLISDGVVMRKKNKNILLWALCSFLTLRHLLRLLRALGMIC